MIPDDDRFRGISQDRLLKVIPKESADFTDGFFAKVPDHKSIAEFSRMHRDAVRLVRSAIDPAFVAPLLK
jgi:hypothetical protein